MTIRVLLVDDSEAVLAFGRAALSGHYQISTAASGVEALSRMQKLQPAAVLLDLSMPQMDGDEVLARMQKHSELAHIPVVILSSEKQRAQADVPGGIDDGFMREDRIGLGWLRPCSEERRRQ